MGHSRKQRSRALLLEAQHQLRQPLNALSLLIGELRQGPGDRDLNAIADDMRYALLLCNAWLDALSELQELEEGLVELKPQAVPLQSVFAGLAETFAPRFAEHGLTFRVVPTQAVARADPFYLQRLLAKLLDNALKFTPSGEVLLGCRREGGGWRVEVWDSGPGVPPEQSDRLFEPFFRLENEVRPRERGLGLGLAYAYRLAKLAGDRLTLRIRRGRGCCFSLTLRQARAEAPRASRCGEGAPLAPEPGVLPNSLQGAQVLLLEGPEAALVRAKLEAWGVGVQSVADAALPRALADSPPLLIAGCEEFEAADGWRVLRQAAGSGETTIVLIGDEPPAGPEQPGPAVHHLRRPVSPARLRALCHFALSRAGRAKPPA